jgi:5-methylcytosine-specific restriction endonuclease McrA
MTPATLPAPAESYADYLQSDRWLVLKQECMSRAGWRCQVCNAHSSKTDLEVHHRSYRYLGKAGESHDLICLCAECHGLFHDHGRLSA